MTRTLQAVRIAVEIGAVVLVTTWGLHAASGLARWLLAGACATLLVAGWGRFVAPRSPSRVDDPARLTIELALFVAVSIAAADAMSPTIGVWFGVLAGADAVALRVTPTPGGRSPHIRRPTLQEEP